MISDYCIANLPIWRSYVQNMVAGFFWFKL